MELRTTREANQLLGHSIGFQHFMEPEDSIPNSQERSTSLAFVLHVPTRLILLDLIILNVLGEEYLARLKRRGVNVAHWWEHQ
jgi:hypothetical protein